MYLAKVVINKNQIEAWGLRVKIQYQFSNLAHAQYIHIVTPVLLLEFPHTCHLVIGRSLQLVMGFLNKVLDIKNINRSKYANHCPLAWPFELVDICIIKWLETVIGVVRSVLIVLYAERWICKCIITESGYIVRYVLLKVMTVIKSLW